MNWMPIVAILYLTTLAALSSVSDSARWCLIASVGASIITIGVYWKDKSAAAHKGWRVPESTLIFLALVGGWPGAAMAQRLLSHKTKKVGFQIVYVLSSLANFVLNTFAIAWFWSR